MNYNEAPINGVFFYINLHNTIFVLSLDFYIYLVIIYLFIRNNLFISLIIKKMLTLKILLFIFQMVVIFIWLALLYKSLLLVKKDLTVDYLKSLVLWVIGLSLLSFKVWIVWTIFSISILQTNLFN